VAVVTVETLQFCEFGLQWVPPPGLTGTRGHYQVPDASQRPTDFDTCVQSAVVAERNGADWVMFGDVTDFYFPTSAWNGETSDLLEGAADPNAVFTCEPIIAAAGLLTNRVNFLWGPVDVVRRAPINIAQMVLTLDHATKGRFAYVLAHGQIDHMRQTGISRIGTKDKFHDGVQIIRKLTHQTEPFAFRGRVWKFDRGALGTTYYGDRPPPMFLAGSGDETLELVGRFADGWYEAPPAPFLSDPAVFAHKIRTIREHAVAAGRDPDEIRIMAWLGVLMMDDRELLERALDHPTTKWRTLIAAPAPVFRHFGFAHPYGGTFNYMKDIVPEWYTKEDFDDTVNRIPREAVRTFHFFGTSDEVIEQVQPWLDMGVTDTMIYNVATLCGSEFMEACTAANRRLHEALVGRRVSRKALDAF
jgi:phthiodiolone/phenolphthiodiolone dimycocerosates ketoreductase